MIPKFLGLDVNSSKMLSDIRFGVHVPMDSMDLTSKKFFKKGSWPRLFER